MVMKPTSFSLSSLEQKNTPSNKTQGKVVVGGNLWCTNRFDYWTYPAGGNPESSLKAAPTEPHGQSVSIAK